ncbi:MAG: hypothetical protein WCG95_09205 [bacterium]
MKAILKFSLPEDNQEFELASKALKLYGTLWDFDVWLRTQIKYNDQEQYEPVREKLRELMNDNRIDFDMCE